METYIITRIIRMIFRQLKRLKRKAKIVIPILVIMLICGIGLLYKNNAFDKVFNHNIIAITKKEIKTNKHQKEKSNKIRCLL